MSLSDNRHYRTGQYLEVLLVILISVSPVISDLLKGILSIFVFLLIFRRKSYYRITSSATIKEKNALCILIVLIVYFALYAIGDLVFFSNYEYSLYNVYVPVNFLAAYSVYKRYEIDDFLELFEKIIFVLLVFSFLGYLITLFAPQIAFSLPSYTYHGTQHNTAYVFNILHVGNYVVTRNTGIAREPGVFQALLNIGLALNLKKEKPQILRIVLFSIGIITTASTTGLLIMVILYAAFIFKNSKKLYGFAFIIVAVVLAYYFRDVLDGQYMKLFGNTNQFGNTDSFQYRWVATLVTFKNSIGQVFGYGNSRFSDIESLGSFDSYTVILGRYGILMLVLIIGLLIKGLRKNWMIIVTILLTFTSQGLWAEVLFAYFYFFSFRKNNYIENIDVNVLTESKYNGNSYP